MIRRCRCRDTTTNTTAQRSFASKKVVHDRQGRG
jgi:hypothetical protein